MTPLTSGRRPGRDRAVVLIARSDRAATRSTRSRRRLRRWLSGGRGTARGTPFGAALLLPCESRRDGVEALWKRQTAANRSRHVPLVARRAAWVTGGSKPQRLLAPYKQEVARSSRAPPILMPWQLRTAKPGAIHHAENKPPQWGGSLCVVTGFGRSGGQPPSFEKSSSACTIRPSTIVRLERRSLISSAGTLK
jgi:hypothetical protein